MFNNFFFFFQNLGVCVIMRKNIVEAGRPRMTIWRMYFACWIIKTTNRHSEYVTFTASPVQQLLHERASMLTLYSTYIACIVVLHIDIVLIAQMMRA